MAIDPLYDFSDSELIEELEYRGYYDSKFKDLVEILYQKRRMNQDFNEELNKLIYDILGKII